MEVVDCVIRGQTSVNMPKCVYLSSHGRERASFSLDVYKERTENRDLMLLTFWTNFWAKMMKSRENSWNWVGVARCQSQARSSAVGWQLGWIGSVPLDVDTGQLTGPPSWWWQWSLQRSCSEVGLWQEGLQKMGENLFSVWGTPLCLSGVRQRHFLSYWELYVVYVYSTRLVLGHSRKVPLLPHPQSWALLNSGK